MREAAFTIACLVSVDIRESSLAYIPIAEYINKMPIITVTKYFIFLRLFHSSTTKLNNKNLPKSIVTNKISIPRPAAPKRFVIPKAVSVEERIAIIKATKSINLYFMDFSR